MASESRRRSFLKTAAVGGVCATSDFGFLATLPRVSASEAKVKPSVVQFAEVEGLVRVLEETPRASLLEQVARRVKSGTSYRELLAAVLLAGIRNVQPRPSVGFKFHCVARVTKTRLQSKFLE